MIDYKEFTSKFGNLITHTVVCSNCKKEFPFTDLSNGFSCSCKNHIFTIELPSSLVKKKDPEKYLVHLGSIELDRLLGE